VFTTSAFTGDATLRRVVLRGEEEPDSLRARRRLEASLRDVDWAPRGLPARSLLFVKRLSASGTLGLARSHARRSLGESASLALEQAASRARHPWLHADAATAGAVVFTDEAEMAACLVRDCLRGVVAERWWWCSVLGSGSPAQWLRQQVLARGEVLVPVATRLMEGASSSARAAAALEAWFARLDDVQVQEALASVERAFALATPPALPAPRLERDAAGVSGRAAEAPQRARIDREEAVALQRLVATVPELRESALGLPQRRLFAQVLAVVRSPSWARTTQLAQALSRIECTATPIDETGDDAKGSPEDVEGASAAAAVSAGAAGPVLAAAGVAPARPRRRRTAARATSRSELPSASHPDIQSVAPPVDDSEPAPPFTASVEAPAPPEALAATPAAETRRAPAAVIAVPVVPSEIRTEFGGIFYLLNAALALGLYGDFTMPRARGLALSPWDWLALIGKAWFGKAFVRDPVWPLLAALAGRRAGEAPGRDFEAPPAWAMDPAWLVPWGRVQSLSVHATRSRLCVHHAAGVIVFDAPRDAAMRPLAQARALCAAHRALRGAKLSCAPFGAAALPRSGTARWLRWMLAYLDARLALTLGAESGDDVPSLVCRCAARITTHASEVDVALQLADLPLSIRIAGLDRDPGWIPAAGRGLRFRFL